jgi:hypothetical protein
VPVLTMTTHLCACPQPGAIDARGARPVAQAAKLAGCGLSLQTRGQTVGHAARQASLRDLKDLRAHTNVRSGPFVPPMGNPL